MPILLVFMCFFFERCHFITCFLITLLFIFVKSFLKIRLYILHYYTIYEVIFYISIVIIFLNLCCFENMIRIVQFK